MRKVHRYIAVFAVFIGLYIAVTGLITQSMDLVAITTHQPASNPTMKGWRVGKDGPPNFQVLSDGDYAAPALPAAFDYDAALTTVLKSARADVPAGPFSFVEFRMADGKPVGQVLSMGNVYRFDASNGTAIGKPQAWIMPTLSQNSFRNTIKDIHRLRYYNEWFIILDIVFGCVMATMLFTGMAYYFKLVKQRRKIKRKALFWKAGGWWRALHRGTALSASLFLTIMILSGIVLATSSLGVSINKAIQHGKRPGLTKDVSSPLADADLHGMLKVGLSAFAARGDEPVKVLRLRYFANRPQAVFVAGSPGEAEQLAYNTRTGGKAYLYERGYPSTDMPFGWQVDQVAKQIHTGDIIGISGRWMSLLTGLALLYLVVSGAWLYWEMYSKRRQRGRKELFWKG